MSQPAPAAAVVAGVPSSRPAWRAPLGLLALTALICFYDLAGGAGFEPIDCWVAQTAREMQEAGEWLVPRFSGETRMQKSPGPYWAVMLAAELGGGPGVDAVAARIPSAVAGVLLVATIWWLTRHIAGAAAANCAGLAASASILVLWWSHRAASDLGLATLTTVSLAALWIGSETPGSPPRRVALWMLGYFAAGVGMLYKMPMPAVVVGLPAILYVLLLRRWSILRSAWHLVGLAVFLLPWLPWAVAVSLVEDRALLKWKVEFLDRFTGAMPNTAGQSSWKHLFTYLGPTAFYTLPWTLSLPAALYRAVRPRAGVRQDGTLFCLIWFASLLVFFTLSAGKEWRYFLPALPPLFVLLGIELAGFFSPARRVHPALDRAGAIAVWFGAPAVLLGGGGNALLLWFDRRLGPDIAGLYDWPAVRNAYLVMALILCVGFGGAALLYVRRRERLALGAIAGTMYVMWLWAWPAVLPKLASQRPYVEFAQRLAGLPAEVRPQLRFVGSPDSRIIWYSDVRMPRVLDQLALLEEQGGRRTLAYEKRRTGERMIELLGGTEPVLLVASLPEFLEFLTAAPAKLAAAGRPLPPLHVWLQTRYGLPDRHFVVAGNRPPPHAEPELRLPAKLRARLVAHGAVLPEGWGR